MVPDPGFVHIPHLERECLRLSDQRGRAGAFHLEPRRRRLGAALYDEILSAQQRVGCAARLGESCRVPCGREHQRGT